MRWLPHGLVLTGAGVALGMAVLWVGSGPSLDTPPLPPPPPAAAAPPVGAPGDAAGTTLQPAEVLPAVAPQESPASPAAPEPVVLQADGRGPCASEDPPILLAVDTRDPDEVRRAIAAGADVNACMDMGEGGIVYALSEALAAGSFEIARLLLDAGADPERIPQSYMQPLELAITARSADLVAALIAAGADVDAVSSGAPLITAAAGTGDATILRLLLEAGANPDVQFYGDAPLHIVAPSPSSASAAALVTAGADVNARNRLGHTPLALAAGAGRLETVRLFLEAGTADVMGGFTAALDGGHHDAALLLAEARGEDGPRLRGCQPVVHAARAEAVRPLEVLVAADRALPVGCLQRALDEARARNGPGSEAERLLVRRLGEP